MFKDKTPYTRRLFLFNDFFCLRINAFVGNYRQIGPFETREIGVD
jgi:hypothetical protein